MAPNIPITTHPILPPLSAADLSIKCQTTGIDSYLQHPSSYLLFASFDLWVGTLAFPGFPSPICSVSLDGNISTHPLLIIGGLPWINLHSIPHIPFLYFLPCPLHKDPEKGHISSACFCGIDHLLIPDHVASSALFQPLSFWFLQFSTGVLPCQVPKMQK